MNWEPHGEEISRVRQSWWFWHYSSSMGDFMLRIGPERGEDTYLRSTAVGPSGACFISEEEELWQCASLKGAGRPVPAKRIDDLPTLVSADHVALLKMNIEGAQVGTLKDAREILAKADAICACCHNLLGEQTRTKFGVEELLECSSFNLLWSPPDSPVYERDFVYATR